MHFTKEKIFKTVLEKGPCSITEIARLSGIDYYLTKDLVGKLTKSETLSKINFKGKLYYLVKGGEING